MCRRRRLKWESSLRFPQSVKLKPSEVVVCSWDHLQVARAARSRQRQRHEDPRLADMMDPKALPFDAKRMFFGGFKIFVEV